MKGSTQGKSQTAQQASTNMALSLSRQNEKNLKKTGNNNSTNKKQKQKPKNKNGPKQRPAPKMAMPIPEKCILQYFSALLDPFGTPEGACIPYSFPVPSSRVKTQIRGTTVCGTTGQGYVYWNPTVCNDVAGVVTTQATSVGTLASQPANFTNTLSQAPIKLPYATAALGTDTGITARLVAGGVRIRYRGTEAGRNGVMYAYEQTTHGRSDTTVMSTTIAAPTIKTMRPQPEGQWFQVFWSGPVKSTETQFGAAVTFQSEVAPLIILIDGTAGDAYEWEAVWHIEYTGPTCVGAQPSHGNDLQFSHGQEIVKKHTIDYPLGSEQPKPIFDELCDALGTTARRCIQGIPDLMEVLAPSMLRIIPFLV